MATPEVTMKGGARAKVRDVGLVVLFFALTLGFLVYPQVWYYRINRELRDYGRAMGDEGLSESNPVMSVLAVTIGVILIVPPIWSWVKCTGRIQRAQELAGLESKLNGWMLVVAYIGMVLTTVAGLAIPAIVQDNLNKVWKTLPEDSGTTAATGPTQQSAADKALES